MIVKNAIHCRRCNQLVESTIPHSTVYCPCGACAADGGTTYIRRIGVLGEDYDERLERDYSDSRPQHQAPRPAQLANAKAKAAGRKGSSTAPSRLGGRQEEPRG